VRMRAEKNAWARKPMAKTAKGVVIYGFGGLEV
jgi:hypothetical protein